MQDIDVQTGYVPGIIGRVTDLHARYYHEHWQFGCFFEAKVATGMSDFLNRYDSERDCIWSLSKNGRIEGSITIEGPSEKHGLAHLRWFIVSDRLRGEGAGNYLLSEAIDFCKRKQYDKAYLWTFAGLDSARHLYEKFGFKLAEQKSGGQWGPQVMEQRFEAKVSV